MLLENRVIDVISSDVLLFENARNPYTERRTFVGRVLQDAKISQPINKKILRKSQKIETFGIKGIDALRLSCAEEAGTDYFITCDDKIAKR